MRLDSVRCESGLTWSPMKTSSHPLFEQRVRTDGSHGRHSEDWFTFLDRVEDVCFGRVRVLGQRTAGLVMGLDLVRWWVCQPSDFASASMIRTGIKVSVAASTIGSKGV